MVLKITLLDYSSRFCPTEAGSMRHLVGLLGCSSCFSSGTMFSCILFALPSAAPCKNHHVSLGRAGPRNQPVQHLINKFAEGRRN